MTKSFPGTVPAFRMVYAKELNWYWITCRRCKGTFKVEGSLWSRTYQVVEGDTRPCPYCFKVSYIRKPKES